MASGWQEKAFIDFKMTGDVGAVMLQDSKCKVWQASGWYASVELVGVQMAGEGAFKLQEGSRIVGLRMRGGGAFRHQRSKNELLSFWIGACGLWDSRSKDL